MTVRFIHLRPGTWYNPDEKKVEGSPFAKGGITLAYELLPESSTIKVAAAICHENDSYSRKRGALIASGRLKKGLITIGAWDRSAETLAEAVLAAGEFLVCGSRS